MPLEKSPTRAAIGRNIKTEQAAGKPKRQAVAIALNTARNAGLDIPQKDQPRQSAPVPKATGNMPRTAPKSGKTKPKIVPKGNGTPPKGLR